MGTVAACPRNTGRDWITLGQVTWWRVEEGANPCRYQAGYNTGDIQVKASGDVLLRDNGQILPLL